MAAEPLSIGIGVPFNAAIAAAKARGVVLPDVYYGQLQGMARQLAFSIAGVASLDQLQAVKASLDKALADGGTFAEWKRSAATMSLGLPEHRLDNIFRTNLQSNYAHGHWQRFEETKARRPYLMYDAINDSRVRPAHLALDGIIRPVDDPFWSSHAPVNGFRCRCGLVSLSESQAKARSGPGKGLDKAIDLDAMKPDKGWDYNPGKAPLQGIEQAVEARAVSASHRMFSALNDKLSQDMKIIDIPGWEHVEKAVAGVAAKRPDWFPMGFQGIHAVSNEELFAATRMGKLYFSDSDELVPGFRPASSLLGALEAIESGGKLSFEGEYAVETLWHELAHGFTGIKPGKVAIGTEPIEEGVVQAFARNSYPALLSELGGAASHQDKVIANGYAYPIVTANLLEAMRRAGITGPGLIDLVTKWKQHWRGELTEMLSVGLGIKASRVAAVYGYAAIMEVSDFIAKIEVLARNAPRSKDGS